MRNSNIIVYNTIVVYSRVAITTIVTFLSSRWILQALGVEDFGLYNLVAGMLSMLMVLNSSMAASTQRYLAYSIGEGDNSRVKSVFTLGVLIHVFISIIVLLLIETGGQWFLLNVLSIPSGREDTAIFCLHCLSISTCFSILSVPYTALLLSYEKMLFISVIQILESILKLVTAILLLGCTGDKLKIYVSLITLISVFASISYAIFSYSTCKTCRFSVEHLNKHLFKDFISFASWSLIGSTSTMLKNQGLAMLLNTFFGVVINAAYGIANQIKGQFMFISSSVVTAAKPQIVQSEGNGNRQRSLNLSSSVSKISFLLLSLISVPFIVEMSTILEIWLVTVPEYTVSFAVLIIITNLVFQFFVGAFLPIESVGRIKWVQITVSLCHCMVIPIGYCLLKLGVSPVILLLVVLIEEIVSLILILLLSKRIVGLNINEYVKTTILPPIAILILCTLIAYVPHVLILNKWLRLLAVVIVSTLSISLFSYLFALKEYEKNKVKEIFQKIKSTIIL